jgi:hypothetical protein
MAGLVPAIHDLVSRSKTWMPETSPGMTEKTNFANHGAIEIGEKSTNQLFGCTKPLIFGLSARGPTSWAT